MRTRERVIGDALQGLGLVCLFITTALALMLGLGDLPARAPNLGDILAFHPSLDNVAEPGIRLLVHRDSGFGCVLDLGVLRQQGGSLVVVSRPSAGGGDYHLHWAGTRTSGDGADCGSDARLIVDGRDVRTLVAATALPIMSGSALDLIH